MKYAENVSLLPKATRARSAAAEAADVAVGRRSSSSIAVLFTTFVPLFRLLFPGFAVRFVKGCASFKGGFPLYCCVAFVGQFSHARVRGEIGGRQADIRL